MKDRLLKLHKAGIKKGDIAITLFLISISLLSFVLAPAGKGGGERFAVLYHKGEEIERISLDRIEEPIEKTYEFDGSKAVIKYKKGSAAFIYSDCHDKLCIQRGYISKQADASVCLPLSLVLIIEGGETDADFDAVVY
jgi:hypothetical protein